MPQLDCGPRQGLGPGSQFSQGPEGTRWHKVLGGICGADGRRCQIKHEAAAWHRTGQVRVKSSSQYFLLIHLTLACVLLNCSPKAFWQIAGPSYASICLMKCRPVLVKSMNPHMMRRLGVVKHELCLHQGGAVLASIPCEMLYRPAVSIAVWDTNEGSPTVSMHMRLGRVQAQRNTPDVIPAQVQACEDC